MISSVELYRWLHQHGPLIKTARISQIYRTGTFELWWALHTKEGKKFLLTTPPEIIALTDDKNGEHKETGFGRWMRDNIKGAIIEEITQVRSERIIQISVRRGPGRYTIFIELFGQGNIIICENNTVLVCLEKRPEVEKGSTYTTPEQFDSFHASNEEIYQKITEIEEMTASKAIATQLGFGGAFAQEICKKIGIDENTSKTSIIGTNIKKAITDILEQPTTLIPTMYFEKKEKIIENKKLKKIQTILREQEKQKIIVMRDIEENTKIGELIYNNYRFFEEAISEYKKKNSIDINKINEKYNIDASITYEKPFLKIENK